MTSLSNFTVPTLPSMPRRSFLRASALAIGGAAVATGGARVALGTPGNPATGDALVVIFLRGAADGLSLTPAIGANYDSYAAARPTIRITPDQSLALDSSNPNAIFPQGLDGVIGLHPAFQPLFDSVWASGNMAVVPGCGMPESESTSRSHFVAEEQMQLGAAGNALSTGFLARLESAQNAQGFANISTSGNAPTIQQGSSQTYNVENLVNFGLQRFENNRNAEAALRQMYVGAGQVNEMGLRTLDAIDRIGEVEPSDAAGYSDSRLSGDLSDVAALLKSDLGVVSASIQVQNWDTHDDQGANGGGFFAEQVDDVAQSVSAFVEDLGTQGMAETNIAIITEFGRTLLENGTGGTDHGRGSTCFFIGGGVQGGVFGYDYFDEYTNPGGTNSNATPVFTDYRQPIEEILAARNNVGGLFPTKASTSQLLGLARAS